MDRACGRNAGLLGKVGERDFLALCDGLNPQSGTRLTQRRNTVRWQDGRQAANRRIFHDFTISPPKSVSVVGLCQDNRIVELHERAVRTALVELEKMAETRVRRSKRNVSQITGNLAAACFRHDTSREPSGALVAADERGEIKTLAHSQCLFVRGYAITSYSSQGKTVDTAIVADVGIRAATSAQQWYVGISRGRKRVLVLTPDKENLRLNIQRSRERELAADVVRSNTAQVVRMPGRSHRSAEMIDLARMHQFVEQQRERQGEQRGLRIWGPFNIDPKAGTVAGYLVPMNIISELQEQKCAC